MGGHVRHSCVVNAPWFWWVCCQIEQLTTASRRHALLSTAMNQFTPSFVVSQNQILQTNFAAISVHALEVLQCGFPDASLDLHNCTGKDDSSKVRKKVYKFWTRWMNNLNKKQIIFSEHFLKQGKLSEKKPKSSVSDAAVTDSGLSVPGKVYLHMLLLVVHIKLSSKIISVLIMYIITSSCALSFSWRVNMCFFLPN